MNLAEEIKKLKEKENAVILAHNYQRPEIQDIADFIGDSLDLAIKSNETDAKYILFAGVDFMTEGAAMMNPKKVVLSPDINSRCPMAAMLPAEKVRAAKKEHPDAEVVLYINTLAEAKAEADVICTSANCLQVINSLDSHTVLFGPDKNLAYYAAKRTGKKIVHIPEDGHCVVHHHLISMDDIEFLKKEHPNAVLIVHPECEPAIQEIADYITSTNGMVKKVRELPDKEFIIGTEEGICYRLKKENPKKEFYPVKFAVCRQMKLHTLEKMYETLKNKKPVVTVDKKIATKAKKALERMFEVTGRD